MFNKQKWKGGGACCCCLYSVQPLRGFLHRAERSFSTTSSFLSREKCWELELCCSSSIPRTWARVICPHSTAVPSPQALNSLGLAQPCPEGDLPCRKRSAGPAAQQSFHRPPSTLLCLSVCTVHSAINLQLWDGTSGTPEIQTQVKLKRFSHVAVSWSAPELFIVGMETE